MKQEAGKVRAQAAARSHPFQTSDLPGTHRTPPFASEATGMYGMYLVDSLACLRSTLAVGSSVCTADNVRDVPIRKESKWPGWE